MVLQRPSRAPGSGLDERCSAPVQQDRFSTSQHRTAAPAA